MSWHKTGTTYYYAQLELSKKRPYNRWFVVYNVWYLEPLDLPNGLGLDCH